MRFADIEFGPDDAKGDAKLAEYFLRIPEYDRVRSGKAWFVVGRKGTGKSAICQMLLAETATDPLRFAVRLSFKDAPTADLLAASDGRFAESRNQFISVWKFVIAVETAKLALARDNSVTGRPRDVLERFLRENFGRVDIACLDVVTELRKRDWKVALPPVADLLKIELGAGRTDVSSHQIHYAHAADAVLRLLAATGSTNTYLLLFDELDEDYGRVPRYHDALISLLKAAYNTRLETTMPKIWPIVVIREDVFLRLDDPDLNKLDDYLVRLQWSPDASRRSRFSLLDVVEQRIRASGWPTDHKMWPSAVQDERWKGGGWYWLVARTMLRPRDAIKYLKLAQRHETGTKLSPEALLASAADYSRWFYDEIGNEIFVELRHWREALGLLTRVGFPFDLPQFEREVASVPALVAIGAEAVLTTLFDYGVLGIVHSNLKAQFKYTSPQLTFDPKAAFVTHPGLRAHLKIRSGGSRLVKEPADPDVRYR